MLARTLVMLCLAGALQGAVVLDRIAVAVGKHAIKTSEIDRDLRVTDFLNRQPLQITPEKKRKAADRLVDQSIVADEMASGGYQQPTQADADRLLDQLRHDRFGGSEAAMREALAKYGLTENQLRARLLWQLKVLRFIDQRFRPAVLVSDEDVRKYYDEHRAEIERAYPQQHTFEAVAPKIRASLEGERINHQFTEWLDETRKQTRIDYHQEAFQ